MEEEEDGKKIETYPFGFRSAGQNRRIKVGDFTGVGGGKRRSVSFTLRSFVPFPKCLISCFVFGKSSPSLPHRSLSFLYRLIEGEDANAGGLKENLEVERAAVVATMRRRRRTDGGRLLFFFFFAYGLWERCKKYRRARVDGE